MNKPVFTKSISAGTRVYYIDANKDKKGQYYVSISEIPTDKTPGVKKTAAHFHSYRKAGRICKRFCRNHRMY